MALTKGQKQQTALVSRLSDVLDEIAHVREHGMTPDSLGTLHVSLTLAANLTAEYRGTLMEGR